MLPWNNPLFGGDPYKAQREQRAAQHARFEAQLAANRAQFQKLLDTIKKLPPEQQAVELDRLQREMEQTGREQREEDMIESQQELTDAINDLRDELQNPLPY